MVTAFNALEIFVLTGHREGRDACSHLMMAFFDYFESRDGRTVEIADDADRQPCYSRDPATAPEAFFTRAPRVARRADLAAARAFLERLEPSREGHEASFHQASLAVVERLGHDLEVGEIEPDWEEVLWRMLRTFLPLVDPRWLAAHRLWPDQFGPYAQELVPDLGRYCAAARPGRTREVAMPALEQMEGVAMSALKTYIFARCALADTECEPLTDALERYRARDWGDLAH